jgi:hypothetical protein
MTAFCFPAPTSAQEPRDGITIAFFAPSIYFRDSVARAGFIGSLAAEVEAEIGLPVRGINVSSASDLAGTDIAIIDGMYFAGSRRGVPLLSAEADFGVEDRLALLVSSDGPSELHELRGATLILPRVGNRLEDFVTSQILRSEMPADEFFGEIQHTSSIESALSAVAQGRADATVAFSSYVARSGLRVVDRYANAPAPVLVQLSDTLSADIVSAIQRAVRSTSARDELSGFVGYDPDSVAGFRRHSRGSRPERTPLMVRSRSITVRLGSLDIIGGDEELSIAPPVDLFEIPELVEP